jgi:hypothetical protein
MSVFYKRSVFHLRQVTEKQGGVAGISTVSSTGSIYAKFTVVIYTYSKVNDQQILDKN